MQSHNNGKILVVTDGREDAKKIHAMFPRAAKDILLARSHMGALELARMEHPQLCLLSDHMLMVQGRYFPDALKEACPGIDIFIAEDQDLGDGGSARFSRR
jgi:CheY-like chemotaxis protein